MRSSSGARAPASKYSLRWGATWKYASSTPIRSSPSYARTVSVCSPSSEGVKSASYSPASLSTAQSIPSSTSSPRGVVTVASTTLLLIPR